MADIELVIKLSEKVYGYAKRYNGSSMLALREMDMCMNAIANELRQSNALSDGLCNMLRGYFNNMTSDCTEEEEQEQEDGNDN